jgi:cytoskeleton protein RodZ
MTEQATAPSTGDVGAELARARQAAGLAVADVAQQLKFARRQIEALEQGRYGDLPAGTFARGMVRAYARLVRIDPEPLVERIAPQVAVPDNAAAVAAVQRPIPIVDNARRTNTAYVVLSLVILVVIAAVAFEWQRAPAKAARMTFVPAAQAPAQAEQKAVAVVTTVTPQITTLGTAEPQAVKDASAAPAPAVTEKTDTEKATDARRRISIKFERESWVEIRGRDGRILTSELNPGGTERTVVGRAPFTLVIGNAHFVRLSYDDRPIDLAPHVKVEVARFTLQ